MKIEICKKKRRKKMCCANGIITEYSTRRWTYLYFGCTFPQEKGIACVKIHRRPKIAPKKGSKGRKQLGKVMAISFKILYNFIFIQIFRLDLERNKKNIKNYECVKKNWLDSMEWRQLGDVKWRDRLSYVGAVLNVTLWLHQETAVKFAKWSQGVQFTNSIGKVNRKNIL